MQLSSLLTLLPALLAARAAAEGLLVAFDENDRSESLQIFAPYDVCFNFGAPAADAAANGVSCSKSVESGFVDCDEEPLSSSGVQAVYGPCTVYTQVDCKGESDSVPEGYAYASESGHSWISATCAES